jgi:aspartate aminotransferase-like enzyme
MASPVGIALTTVSDRGWDAIKNRKTPIRGTYNNMLHWKGPIPGECEPPMPAVVIHAIRARLDYIFRHGPEKIFKRHEIAARALRLGLVKMGLELLVESTEAPPCSHVTTVVKLPPGVREEAVTKIMCERYNMWFGLSPYREGVFQLGTIHENQVCPRHILYYLTSLGLTLSELGVKIRLEEAIRKANEVLLELEKYQ